jgi:hypothetical protein
MASCSELKVFGALVAVLIATAGCSSSSSQSPGRSTAQQMAVARTLKPAPISCPEPKPKREKVSPRLGPLAGQRPVWAGFYARLDMRTGTLHLLRDTRRTTHGWRIKTLWAVAADEHSLVGLRGHDIETGAAVKFEVGEAAVSTAGLLNPAKPGTPTPQGEPKEFPSYLYFPAAGCYELSARWQGGSWKMALGVGR